MSKVHIDKMAGAVKKYYGEAVVAEQKIRQNSEIFMPEHARPENEKIMEQLQAARQAAEEAIAAAEAGGRAEAAAWGELDGSKITDDAKLLQFDISPEQFDRLVQKYRNNSTMSELLSNFAERMNGKQKENGEFGKMPEKWYNTAAIPTAAKKAEVVGKFAAGARDLLARIDSPNQFGGGTGSQMLKLAVETFGQPDGTSAHLFDML